MGLFDKLEVNPRLREPINQGLAIGIAMVDDIGKASVELSQSNLIIKSYTTNQTLKIPLSDLDFASYSTGNFLVEDKIHLGVSGRQYSIASTNNNETELRNFYENILKVKENEKPRVKYENKEEIHHTIIERGYPINQEQKEEEPEDSEPETHHEKFDPAEEIRKYHSLMKDGIISEKEFENKKEELLNYKYQ